MTRLQGHQIQNELNTVLRQPSGVVREQYNAFEHRMLFRYDLPRTMTVTWKVDMEDLDLSMVEFGKLHLVNVVKEARKLLEA